MDDILAAIGKRPTVGAYVAKVLPTISAGSRRAYGTYVRRFAEDYADHAVASITVTDVVAFTLQVEKRAKASRGDRRNSRDGRSARENAITGLRALFARAVDEGLITDNPASKVPKPARSPEPRRALNQDEIEELCEVTSTGGDDPELDMLIVRFLLESGARREGLLALRCATSTSNGARCGCARRTTRTAPPNRCARRPRARWWRSLPRAGA